MSYHLPKKTIIYKDNHIPLIITPTFWTPQKRTNPELRVGCWGTNNQDWRQMFPHLWHVSKTKKKLTPPKKKTWLNRTRSHTFTKTLGFCLQRKKRWHHGLWWYPREPIHQATQRCCGPGPSPASNFARDKAVDLQFVRFAGHRRLTLLKKCRR